MHAAHAARGTVLGVDHVFEDRCDRRTEGLAAAGGGSQCATRATWFGPLRLPGAPSGLLDLLVELGLTLLFRGLRGLRLRCPPALVFASHDGLSPAGLHTRRTPTVARIARMRDAVCGSGRRLAVLGPRRSSATCADGRIVRFGFLPRADGRERCRVPLSEIQRSAVRSALLTATVGVFGPA